jgi:CHAD domain-containing protein
MTEGSLIDEPRAATIRSTGRLASQRTQAHAVNARPLHIRRGMSAEDAFRVTVLECLAHVSANIGAVTRSRDVEGLHQLRVGLRRLHVAFSAFGEEFQTTALKELRRRTKAFTQAVAPARDLDVFAEELFLPAESSQDGDAFRTLGERMERARAEAWNDAVEHISSIEFAVFLDEVAAAAEGRAWLRLNDGDFKRRLAIHEPVASIAGRMLDEHLVRARKRGRRLKTLAQRDCHRFRITLKKLRYASEFYGPLYRPKKVKRYVAQIKQLQNLLGALNDVSHVRATLSRLTADDSAPPRVQADLSFAAGLINGWHRARAARMGKKAVRRWERFKHVNPFWRD